MDSTYPTGLVVDACGMDDSCDSFLLCLLRVSPTSPRPCPVPCWFFGAENALFMNYLCDILIAVYEND
jgi:hypothetical protein